MEPVSGVPRAELARRLVDTYTVDGVFDRDWFAALRLERPERRGEIDELEALRGARTTKRPRPGLAADLEVVVSHLVGMARASTLPEALVYCEDLSPRRTLALLGLLESRDLVEWDVTVRDGAVRASLQLLRGFRTAFLRRDRESRTDQIRALLPRARVRVFVSYSGRADMSPLTRALCRRLDELGCSVFLDETSIVGGAEWRTVLLEELRRAGLFVALANDAYWSSAFCHQELGGAYALGKSVLIFCDGTAPQGFAEAEQYYAVARLPPPGPVELATEISDAVIEAYEQKIRDGSRS